MFLCPRCSGETLVTQVYHHILDATKRRRKCTKCKFRFNTFEKIVHSDCLFSFKISTNCTPDKALKCNHAVKCGKVNDKCVYGRETSVMCTPLRANDCGHSKKCGKEN